MQFPMVPVDVLVADDGSVATLDEWETPGVGQNVVVLFGPDGRLLRRHSLEDLLVPEELALVPRSVTSRQWEPEARFDLSKGVLFVTARLCGRRTNPCPTKELQLSFRTGELLNRSPSGREYHALIIRRFEAAQDDEARAMVARLLIEQTDPSLAPFWMKVLGRPGLDGTLLYFAMQGIENTGSESDFQTLEKLFAGRQQWIRDWVVHQRDLRVRGRAVQGQ